MSSGRGTTRHCRDSSLNGLGEKNASHEPASVCGARETIILSNLIVRVGNDMAPTSTSLHTFPMRTRGDMVSGILAVENHIDFAFFFCMCCYIMQCKIWLRKTT